MRYPGGKARLAPWILSHMPPHQVYVEPFFGGGSVFFGKQRVPVEVVNDLDDRVVNLYRVLREQPDELIRLVTLTPYALTEYQESTEITGEPLEDARRFLVRVWMAHGGKLGSISGWRRGWNGGNDGRRGSSATVWAGLPERLAQVVDRLTGVMIDCRPAVDVIAGWAVPDCVIYADPPYPLDTRNRSNRLYRHEMTDQDHVELIAALEAHPGPVLLSGYRCDLYDELLTHWTRVDRDVVAYAQAERTESLWLNPVSTNFRRQLTMEMHP
jgi:DNA adenine methylase